MTDTLPAVLAETVAARGDQPAYSDRHGEDGWRTLLNNLDRIADHAASRGVEASLHPHMGTMIETGAETGERVTLKKCRSSLPEPIIMPRKVISLSGGRRRLISSPAVSPRRSPSTARTASPSTHRARC